MKINKMNKSTKYQKNLLSGFLLAFMILFGAASCNQGTEGGEAGTEAEEDIAETQNSEYDENMQGETNTELVADEAKGDFDKWDTNGDGVFDESEFRNVVRNGGFYTRWDADQDGTLAGDELSRGIYGIYDGDDDGTLSAEEFDSWNTAWGGDYNYEAWDTNDDEVINSDEFRAGIGEAGVFDAWDNDNNGLYTEEEVYAGLYNTWDNDEDSYLTSEEYEDFDYNLWGL